MLVSLISFFITCVSVAGFFLTAILCRNEALLIIFMGLTPISALLGMVFFYKSTNKYPLNNVSEYFVKEFRKLFKSEDGFYSITFIKKDGFWICEHKDGHIKLNLGKYFFQKSYIISFVIRNLRYPFINEKLPLEYLFWNVCLFEEPFNLKLILINKNKKFEKLIVKNGVSKYGFIGTRITFSPFYLASITTKSHISLLEFIPQIDEIKYSQLKKKKK